MAGARSRARADPVPARPAVRWGWVAALALAGAVQAAGPDEASALCLQQEGAKPSDALLQSLPEAQRQAVAAALRGLMMGLARDPAGRELANRVTLKVDASRNAILCLPRPQAGTYVAHRIEPNGRMEILQAGEAPLVFNDANEPQTVVTRCSELVTSCVRSARPGPSLDECVAKQPPCPAGRLDPALACCPQACKDAFRRERAAGGEPVSAFLKVLFGNGEGAASCVPGFRR